MPEPMIWLLIDPRNGRRGKVVAREGLRGPYAQECDPGMAASIPERRPTMAEAVEAAERMVARKLAKGFKLIEVA
jgi:hypothetical protein